MKQTGALKKLFFLLLLVVLLPALFYSGYEINSLSTSEELISTIYRQQLDGILFSLNQYALDVATNWVSAIGVLCTENKRVPEDSLKNVIEKYLVKNSSIRAIIFSDSSLTNYTVYSNSRAGSVSSQEEKNILQTLKIHSDKIERLLRYQKVEYRKIEPIQIKTDNNEDELALLFVVGDNDGKQTVITLILNEQTFVREILSARLREAAGTEFFLAVYKEGAQQPLVATASVQGNDAKQKKQLWLFPRYSLGIALLGESVEELTQARFTRNLILILLLDVILLIGVWFVYRNIRQQMEFVKLKSDFVSNVSHELRTPLALIRMYAETLDMARIKNEEKKKEYYSTILQETERLTRLVNNILDFSKLEAGKKQYNFQEVALNDVITAILETYQFHLQSEKFDTKIDLQEDLPTLYGDKEAISETVMNILDNAIKYSSDQKYLRVTTGTTPRMVYVEVEDRGIGIASEHHKKIFENFFRVSDGLVHNVKGSGLGLALVQHIMDAHKGKIQVKSALGKGSIFRLEFPVTSKQ